MKVLTIGTWDVFHKGHVNLLKKCRELAGVDGEVIIGVNSDEFVKRYKGALPLVPEESRMECVRAYGRPVLHINRMVPIPKQKDDALGRSMSQPWMPTEWDETTPTFIHRIKPNLIVVGSDWAKKAYYKQLGITQKWLDERQIGLCYLTYTAGVSSTGIKARRG